MEGLPLPARVLRRVLPVGPLAGNRRAGRRRSLAALRAARCAKEWEADFRGDLLDVDLKTLVGQRFPSHRLDAQGKGGRGVARRWADRPGQG